MPTNAKELTSRCQECGEDRPLRHMREERIEYPGLRVSNSRWSCPIIPAQIRYRYRLCVFCYAKQQEASDDRT